MSPGAPSLFWRLMAAISCVLLAGAAALAYAAHNYALRAADDAYDKLLLGAASQIGETVRLSGGEVTTDIPVSAFEMLSASRRERVYYRVTGPGGALATGYADLTLPAGVGAPGPEQRLWDAVYKGSDVRAAASWHYVSDQQVSGWATVVVAQTRNARDALARELTIQAMSLVGIMSLIALAGAAVAIRFALRPLHRIEDALSSRDPNDLTPLDLHAPAEIEALVQSIDRFMQRLSVRMDAMQKTIADAAHQLRTPITALAAQVDLLQRETEPARARNQIERIAARTAQVGRLVSQLLSQAMVAHRAQSMTAASVDLRDVVRLAIADAVPAAMTRDIAVEVSTGESPQAIEGDGLSLREAVRNVVENAVHHGAETRIVAGLRREASGFVIEIADDGPGIPEEQWPQAAERFHRGSPDGTGSGLGLAIAADVMRAHGGSLSFGRDADGLFRVRLWFPAAMEKGA